MSIEVQNIRKTFGSFTALDNVSLNFPDGQLVALLGPSGCGKTTLLRIIAGLERPDSGRIVLDGEDASGRHVRERAVGFVFQHYALFRHMTVFDNVAFGLRVKPRAIRPSEAEISKKVKDLLELVQLGWLADRFPSQLSGGQRQRIALARALAVEPRVLLLDEPFGALDAQVRKELRRWLRRLHDELHITSVFVTHDQEEALEVADKIVLLNKGRIEQIGTPNEIYDEPATSFAYSFIGTANKFRGRVEGGRVRIGNDTLPVGNARVSEGQDVIAYVRPHEVEIVTSGNDDRSGISATVSRLLKVGGITRVELLASHGVNGSTKPEIFEVELTASELQELGLASGQHVRLVSDRLQLFPADNATAGR